MQRNDFDYWYQTYSRPSWNLLGKFILAVLISGAIASPIMLSDIFVIKLIGAVIMLPAPLYFLFKFIQLFIKETKYIFKEMK
jgi:hypothetical protein